MEVAVGCVGGFLLISVVLWALCAGADESRRR